MRKDWRDVPMIAPLVAEQQRREREAERAYQETLKIIRRLAGEWQKEKRS